MVENTASHDAYGAELDEVIGHITKLCAETSIRGANQARFVYARSGAGAVEISKDRFGDVFVEYWRAEEDSPAREVTYASYEEAIADVTSWLKGTHPAI